MIVSWWQRQLKKAEQDDTVSVMPRWSIWVGALALIAVGALSMWILFGLFGTGTAQDKTRLEIVKLAGSVVVGTGGAAALFLAARRQRSAEVRLRQSEKELDIKRQATVDSRYDARERRITELYAGAAEQLGSDRAPVRLAALYALERLAQYNENHRQTVVDLFCAYLRMPFTHPNHPPASQEPRERSIQTSRSEIDTERMPVQLDLAPGLVSTLGPLIPDGTYQQEQELQVRLTAQRILRDHLRPAADQGEGATSSNFWSNMDLDLTGAMLDEFDLSGCHIGSARFRKARFVADQDRPLAADFSDSHFLGDVDFDESNISGARFRDAHFHGKCAFSFASLDGVDFRGTNFHRGVEFDCTNLLSAAFNRAIFFRYTRFGQTDFGARDVLMSTDFSGAHFQAGVMFDSALFSEVTFEGACFDEGADFAHAKFFGEFNFDISSCGASVSFERSIIRMDSQGESTYLPFGWKVVPCRSDQLAILHKRGLEGDWAMFMKESITSPDGRNGCSG